MFAGDRMPWAKCQDTPSSQIETGSLGYSLNIPGIVCQYFLKLERLALFKSFTEPDTWFTHMNRLRLASILAVSALAGASPIYTLADLGTLGGSSAVASGVNDVGQAVGTMTTPSGFMNAFSFSGSSLTSLSPATAAQANGINNTGQVAGSQDIGGQSYATVWNNGVATAVAGAGSYGMAINNSGGVAGMLVNNGQGNAFVAENGTVIDLGTFSGGNSRPLVLRWNGHAWGRVTSPARVAELNGLGFAAAGYGWAVGRTTPDSGNSRTLILHWNGRSWS